MRLDGLIFDLDGTLVDNLAGDCEAFIRALAEHGHPGFTPADIVGMFGPSSEGIVRSVAGEGWEECWEAYCRYYEEELRKLGPVPGTVELMDWARLEGLRIGLVTGGSERVARMTLTAVGLDRFGASARFGSTGGSIKRRCIEEVVAEWCLAPGKVAYLGDAARDMAIAKDAGVVGLGAAWCSTTDPEALKQAGAVAVFMEADEVREGWPSRFCGGEWRAGVTEPVERVFQAQSSERGAWGCGATSLRPGGGSWLRKY